MPTQDQYSQGYTQDSTKRGGKCSSCFGGSSKMLSADRSGTSPAGTQYAMATQDQYSQGYTQNSPKRGGKCPCFGGSSKMVGAGSLDAQQTQANVQTSTKSRGKCPCFGGPTKMVGAGVGVMGPAVVVPSVQRNTPTYET